jgi:hypothetical protein
MCQRDKGERMRFQVVCAFSFREILLLRTGTHTHTHTHTDIQTDRHTHTHVLPVQLRDVSVQELFRVQFRWAITVLGCENGYSPDLCTHVIEFASKHVYTTPASSTARRFSWNVFTCANFVNNCYTFENLPVLLSSSSRHVRMASESDTRDWHTVNHIIINTPHTQQ